MSNIKNKKIYIIGPVGSGKTTLAKRLSVKYNIEYYELDKVVWNDEESIKRPIIERNKIFNEIISKKEWIIEDVGRECFQSALNEADIIYYINLNTIFICFRIVKRWIKQKLDLEASNYKPTIKGLIQMFLWLDKDIKNKNKKLRKIKMQNKNLIILNYRELSKLV